MHRSGLPAAAGIGEGAKPNSADARKPVSPRFADAAAALRPGSEVIPILLRFSAGVATARYNDGRGKQSGPMTATSLTIQLQPASPQPVSPWGRVRRRRSMASWDLRWLRRPATLTALAAALLGHALLVALWMDEEPAMLPPPVAVERLTVQLLESPPVATPSLAAEPALDQPVDTRRNDRLPPASRPAAAPVPAEITAPVAEDSRSERIAIDWQSAINAAARAQSQQSGSGSERFGKAIPALPGDSSRSWSDPPATPRDRLRQLGGMMSPDQLVGGSGLNSLVAAGPMEQAIDRHMVDLQSECHAGGDGRLICPQRKR